MLSIETEGIQDGQSCVQTINNTSEINNVELLVYATVTEKFTERSFAVLA